MNTTPEDATPADELPGRLAARRKSLGISQATAAQRADVTLRTWQRWETGATRAHFGHLPAMARALETTPEELLGGSGGGEAPRALEDLRLEARLVRIEAMLAALLAAQRVPVPEDPQKLLDEVAGELRGRPRGRRSRGAAS